MNRILETTAEWSAPRVRRVFRIAHWPWLIAAALALQACGGGGGGDDGGSAPPPAPPPPVVAPSALSYSTPQTYMAGTQVTPLAPAVTGTVTSYAVAPALPSGLTLDPATGRIAGTPSTATPSAAYTVTASNSAGSTTFALTITVEAAVPAPSGLSYAAPQPFTVDVAIAPLDPTVTGTVSSYSVTPALPAGLALDAATGRISGTPTAPSAPTEYAITAANAGGSTGFALTLSVLLERSTTDRADEVSGRQVHVLYVVPSDGTDQQLDVLGSIDGSVRSWNAWLAGQTGGRTLRVDTYDGGKIDVSFLRLDRTDDQMNVAGGNARNKLEYHVLARGFDSPDKIYLVYYGGRGDGCGRGAWPPTLHGNVGAVYLLSPNCSTDALAAAGDPPRYWDLLAAHEVAHVLGFAPTCAPHHMGNGHVNDSSQDLMAPIGAQRSTLDVNHDDYFGAAIAGCPDFSSSELLEPLPAGATLPPGWPYVNLTDDGCATEATVIPGPLGADTQATFVNDYGAGNVVQIWQLEQDMTTGLNRRTSRVFIPYLEGAVLPVKENAVLVATVENTCVAVVRTPAAISRFVVRP